MKLDRGTVCPDIMLKALEMSQGTLKPEHFWFWLADLDLVFKPNDTSQSVLVESKPK